MSDDDDHDRPDENDVPHGDGYSLAGDRPDEDFEPRPRLYGRAPVQPLPTEHMVEASSDEDVETYDLQRKRPAPTTEPRLPHSPKPWSEPPEHAPSPVGPTRSSSDRARGERRGHWRAALLARFVGCVAGACLATLSLVLSRLVTLHVGATVHASAAVVTTVFGGLCLGSLIGGWLGSRQSRSVWLPVALLLGSLGMAGPIVANEALAWIVRGDWSLPTWTFAVAAGIGALPATCLGVVLVMACHAVGGRSVNPLAAMGGVLAAAALGVAAGTCLTTLYLVDVLGTQATIGGMAAVLAVTAAITASGRNVFRVVVLIGWLPFLTVTVLLADANADAGRRWGNGIDEPTGDRLADIAGGLHMLGRALGLRSDGPDEYRDESRLRSIRVTEEERDGARVSVLDVNGREYGLVDPARPDELVESHLRVVSAILAERRPARTLFLGGGTYALPRWYASRNRGRTVEVIDDDPAIRRAAEIRFDLPPTGETSIRTFVADPRIAVRERADRRQRYDVIVADLFRSPRPPWHVATREFADELRGRLEEDGCYVALIADAFPRTESPDALASRASVEFRGAVPKVLQVADLPVGESRMVNRGDIADLRITRRTEQRFGLHVERVLSGAAFAELDRLGEGHSAFREAVAELHAASNARVAYTGRVPEAIRGEVAESDAWRALAGDVSGLEVREIGDGFLFGVRGPMTDALRSRLRTLGADNRPFLDLVDDLATRSRARRTGRFLGRFTTTLADAFPHVTVFTTGSMPSAERVTFVVVASSRPLRLDASPLDGGQSKAHPLAVFGRDDTGRPTYDRLAPALKALSGGRLLTDDFAPVGTLVVPPTS